MHHKKATIIKTNAHLPEISVYKKFLEKLNFNVIIDVDKNYRKKNIDLVWFFAGIQKSLINAKMIIVDYRSRSTGYFYLLKDLIKIFTNRSNLNIFCHKDLIFYLSKYILRKKTYYLPMGSFCKYKVLKKKYDFIHIGAISKLKTNSDFYELIYDLSKKYKIILIGKIDQANIKKLKRIKKNLKIINKNLPINILSKYINQSKFGISWYSYDNYLKGQISTKILDYDVCKLPILCNDSHVNNYTFKHYSIKNFFYYKIKSKINLNFSYKKSKKNLSFNDIFKRSELYKDLCKLPIIKK